jgi:hypothetical protein
VKCTLEKFGPSKALRNRKAHGQWGPGKFLAQRGVWTRTVRGGPCAFLHRSVYTPKFSRFLMLRPARPDFADGSPARLDPPPPPRPCPARDIGTGSGWRAGACHLASMVKYLAVREAHADPDAEEISGTQGSRAKRAKSTKRRAKSKRWLSHKISHRWARSGLGRSQQGGATRRFQGCCTREQTSVPPRNKIGSSRVFLLGSDEPRRQK